MTQALKKPALFPMRVFCSDEYVTRSVLLRRSLWRRTRAFFRMRLAGFLLVLLDRRRITRRGARACARTRLGVALREGSRTSRREQHGDSNGEDRRQLDHFRLSP